MNIKLAQATEITTPEQLAEQKELLRAMLCQQIDNKGIAFVVRFFRGLNPENAAHLALAQEIIRIYSTVVIEEIGQPSFEDEAALVLKSCERIRGYEQYEQDLQNVTDDDIAYFLEGVK